MTRFTAVPLRGGQAWPGVDTLTGQLDDGTGTLTDRSKNVMINQADILAKRKGFTRGLDEQFIGVVCGLHKYTSECGIEYLLVADESEINIRTPFAIPVFEVSDAYPNDGFSGTTSAPDLTRWNDPSQGYRHLESRLVLKSGVLSAQPLEWFKEAASLSYGIASQFSFPNDASTETVRYFIRSADTNGNGSIRLQIANTGGALLVTMSFVNVSGTSVELASGAPPTTSLNGTVTTFQYKASTRTAKATLFVDGSGTPLELEMTLTASQDADLGLKSMIQISYSAASEAGVDEISGAPV